MAAVSPLKSLSLVKSKEPHVVQRLNTVRIALDVGTLFLRRSKTLHALLHLLRLFLPWKKEQ